MAEEKKEEPKKTEKKNAADGKIAVVLVRGHINTRHDVKKTLSQLKLFKKNYCVVLPAESMGMVLKVKDYVTWGPVDDSEFKNLISKKGEEYKGKLKDSKGKVDYSSRYIEVDGKKYKKFFRLNSPKKGYGRKGIKTPFSQGGGLGNRGEKIKDLIANMM